MGESANLVSVSLSERDTGGDVLCVWSYPSTDNDLEATILARAGLLDEFVSTHFVFCYYQNTWLYIYTQTTDKNSEKLPKVTSFALCVQSKSFDPEKHSALCKILANAYLNTGNPVRILEGYLSVFTSGQYENNSLSFNAGDFDSRRALLATPLKDVVKIFGVETILIWTALLLKKRVVVYCDRLVDLQRIIRALPVLVWHRQNWKILRPFMNNDELSLNELKNAGVYCAGFTDPTIQTRDDLYDIFVDIAAESITVAEHAKADFGMTSIHKDIAMNLISSAEEESDQAVVKGLALKTKELLSKLQSLRTQHEDGRSFIDLEQLQEQFPANMSRFLYNVALAENMTAEGA